MRQLVASLFKHVLVPLDFTPKNAAALRVALDLAKQNQARVTLLHVIETIEYAEDEEIASFYENLKKRARAKFSACAERFKKAHVPVSEKIVMGKTARGIVSYSLRNGIDLVVLSSHKVRLTEAPKGWATLSYQVSILCQCPVMLVK
jgi:nucleotide-binding universal stress UspA family protein